MKPYKVIESVDRWDYLRRVAMTIAKTSTIELRAWINYDFEVYQKNEFGDYIKKEFNDPKYLSVNEKCVIVWEWRKVSHVDAFEILMDGARQFNKTSAVVTRLELKRMDRVLQVRYEDEKIKHGN